MGTLPFLSTLLPMSADQSAGKALFDENCTSCHTIGKGKLVGPDLKGVTAKRDSAWLKRVIIEPDVLLAEGDPIVKGLVDEYGMEMPGLGLEASQAEDILAYLESTSVGKTVQKDTDTAPTHVVDVGDPVAGMQIFTGEKQLENGGPACISCHNVEGAGYLGGGTLAVDLTGAHSKFGDAGLKAALKKPPFPLMKDIYAKKPLVSGEIANLNAFFRDGGSGGAGGPGLAGFILMGIIGAFIIMGVFGGIWKDRITEIRKKLIAS